MRENRPSGSEGGAGANPPVPTPIEGIRQEKKPEPTGMSALVRLGAGMCRRVKVPLWWS